MNKNIAKEEIYRGLSYRLLQSLNKARSYLKIHKPSLGAYGEHLLRDLLKKVVPGEYGICQGFIMKHDEEIKSNQCDIIIYKKGQALIKSFGDIKFVSVNSVKAIIEVKSSITEHTFHTTLRACERLQNMGVAFTILFVYGKLTAKNISVWLSTYKNPDKINVKDDFIAKDAYLYDWCDIQ